MLSDAPIDVRLAAPACAEHAVAQPVVVEQRRGSVGADQPVTERSAELVQTFDAFGERLVGPSEGGQLEAEEQHRVALGAEDQPPGDRHRDHEQVEHGVDGVRGESAPGRLIRVRRWRGPGKPGGNAQPDKRED